MWYTKSGNDARECRNPCLSASEREKVYPTLTPSMYESFLRFQWPWVSHHTLFTFWKSTSRESPLPNRMGRYWCGSTLTCSVFWHSPCTRSSECRGNAKTHSFSPYVKSDESPVGLSVRSTKKWMKGVVKRCRTCCSRKFQGTRKFFCFYYWLYDSTIRTRSMVYRVSVTWAPVSCTLCNGVGGPPMSYLSFIHEWLLMVGVIRPYIDDPHRS